jgi:hypothetical protein
MILKKLIWIAGMIFCSLAATAQIEETNWTGLALDGLWESEGNWDNGVPDLNKNAIITITANTTITISGNASCNNLTVINSSANRRINLNFSGAIFDIDGDILLDNATGRYIRLNINSGSLQLAGQAVLDVLNNEEIIFDTNTAMVYDGSGAQTIVAVDYQGLTISGDRTGATITIGTGAILVEGVTNFTATNYVTDVEAGSIFEYVGKGDQTIMPLIYEELDISTSGVVTFSSGDVEITGDFFYSGDPAAVTAGNTVIFNGSNQDLNSGNLEYNDITFRFGVTATENDGFTANGNVLFNQNVNLTLAGNGNNLNFNGDVTAFSPSTITGGGNNIITLGGGAPDSFASIPGMLSIGTLSIERAEQVEMYGDISASTVNLITGAELDSDGQDKKLTVNDMANNGVYIGDLIFTGNGATMAGTGTYDLNSLTIQASANVTCTSNFGLTAGRGSTQTAGAIVNDGTFAATAGTATFYENCLLDGSQPITLNNATVYYIILPEVIGSLTASATTPLIINGDFTVDGAGVFDPNGGTVEFDGGIAQTLISDLNPKNLTFHNLSLGAFTELTVNSNIFPDVEGTITLGNGSTLNTNNNMTLVSDIDTDANIASVPFGATISGNINVQRYVSSKGKVYRFFSSPILDGTVDNIVDAGISTQFMFYYEPDAGSTGLGYIKYNTPGLPLTIGEGYLAYQSDGDINSKTISWVGTPNIGTYLLDGLLSFIPNGGVNEGWNLIGNPLPSDISWDPIIGRATNIVDGVAIWDGNKYIYYSSGGGMMDFDGTIAKGQSFWVQTTAVGATLDVRESDKVSPSSPGIFYRKKPVVDKMQTSASVVVTLSDLKGNSDDTYLIFSENSTLERDIELDFGKLGNQIFNLSTLTSEGYPMAINHVGLLNEEKVIDLQIGNIQPGTYELELSRFEASGSVPGYYLLDQLTGESVDITNDKYEFSVTSDPSSYSDRFNLVFTANDPVQQNLIADKEEILIAPNPVKDLFRIISTDRFGSGVFEYTIYDIQGKMIEKKTQGINSEIIDTSKWKPGLYIVEVTNSNNMVREKIIKE